jgi:hypothetical protein
MKKLLLFLWGAHSHLVPIALILAGAFCLFNSFLAIQGYLLFYGLLSSLIFISNIIAGISTAFITAKMLLRWQIEYAGRSLNVNGTIMRILTPAGATKFKGLSENRGPLSY